MYPLHPLHVSSEIFRNYDPFNKFKSLVVLYSKYFFKCLERENFDGVISIKFSTNLCNQNNFSMLVVYRKNNSHIAQFVGYITYLAITKHADLILGDFNKDSISEGPIKLSLQSLGFSRFVSESTHIRAACLDHIYIRNTQNKFSCFEVKMESVYYSDHDTVFFYYER